MCVKIIVTSVCGDNVILQFLSMNSNFNSGTFVNRNFHGSRNQSIH